MADFTMTVNPFKVTNVADTSDHTLIFTGLPSSIAVTTIKIDNISGTISFSVDSPVDATNSPTYTNGDTIYLDIRKTQTLHIKGSAGSETFRIAALG